VEALFGLDFLFTFSSKEKVKNFKEIGKADFYIIVSVFIFLKNPLNFFLEKKV